jgi:CheY-like chemotaxis protein
MHADRSIAGENDMSVLVGKRILIVEDEVLVAMLLEDMVAELGAVVAGTASNLEQALAFVAQKEFDAAILDMNLGDHDSKPVAEALKSRSIPFLFATGYGGSASNPHDIMILEKPYALEEIEYALKSLWDQ